VELPTRFTRRFRGLSGYNMAAPADIPGQGWRVPSGCRSFMRT
jgi:hypothetical protein